MKGWIELSILTHNEESSKLEKLGIEVNYNNIPFKKHLVQVSCISAINLESEGDVVITIDGQQIEVKESVEEIIELIKNNVNI